MIESALSQYIASAPAFAALCSEPPYPLLLPQPLPTLPALTYQVVSGELDSTMDGSSGYVEYRMQYDAWARTYGDAKRMQATVRSLMDGLSGTFPDGTVVQNVMADDEADLFEPETKLYRCRTDYKVQFSR